MSQGKPRKEYFLHEAKVNNKCLFEETMEDKILKELKKDEIADDKWLDNHRKEAIKLTKIKYIEKVKEILIKEIKLTKEIIWELTKQERIDLSKPYELALFNYEELLNKLEELK